MDIIIVEDSLSVRHRLISLLDGQNDFRVLGAMESAEDAVKYLTENRIDLVILDLGLPGVSGEAAVRAISNASPDTNILVFTAGAEDDKVFPALKAGAIGYLLKDCQPMSLITAIEEIKNGGSPMSPPIARKVLREFQQSPAQEESKAVVSPLSRRESQVLELLYQGLNFIQIADILCISSHTVHAHIKKIYCKLNVNSRSQAIYEALRMQLLKR